ncbi:hypothetical protein PoB_005452300 [Plakobranchus ocellatus]|uniref:Uncharacterized protein n=1 Tax=Plakobranchus ocellatus TaxID=259542 RepID=A0AAV4CAK6_9GAST|nr:hypothetical protein PoB_005452300 [Plakobranchus ocellatus]
MHDRKHAPVRTVTPIINEPTENMAKSDHHPELIENGRGILPDQKLLPDQISLLPTAESPQFVETLQPITINTERISPGNFYLQTPQPPFFRESAWIEKSIDERNHFNCENTELTEHNIFNPDKEDTPLPLTKERTMSPAERMGFIRTVVDDLDDDFMSSSYSSSRGSFSNRQRPFPIVRRTSQRGGSNNMSSQLATPIYPSTVGGVELMDYAFSTNVGEKDEAALDVTPWYLSIQSTTAITHGH